MDSVGNMISDLRFASGQTGGYKSSNSLNCQVWSLPHCVGSAVFPHLYILLSVEMLAVVNLSEDVLKHGQWWSP